MVLKNLNLEEQEQIAQIKGFWEQYGRLIILVLVVLLVVIAGWASWQFWQNHQAKGAAVVFDELNDAVMSQNAAQAKDAVSRIQADYGRTDYASHAALIGAKLVHDQGDIDGAKNMLQWVVDNGREPGLKALAVLRLADILIDQKSYDAALTVLNTSVPKSFAGLIDDKRGNVYLGQGKTDEAKAAYSKAFVALKAQPYQQVVSGKLELLGVDTTMLLPQSADPVPNSTPPSEGAASGSGQGASA